MAKVNVEFDTVEKTMSVTMDGSKIDNATSVFMGCGYDDQCYCEIGMVDQNKEEGYLMQHRLVANSQGVLAKVSEIEQQIHKYFAKK